MGAEFIGDDSAAADGELIALSYRNAKKFRPYKICYGYWACRFF